jgi:cytochrome P450
VSTLPRIAELPMAERRTDAYAILRDAGPVARGRFGSYMITSSEAAEFALKHPEIFSSRQAFDVVGSPLPLVPIAFDPPEHTRYRRILQPFFSPRGIAAWQPAVRALAGELIEALAGRGECDLVADLAVPLPAQVFLTLFGLPLEDRDRLIAWKDGLLNDFGPPAEPAAPAADLAGGLPGSGGGPQRGPRRSERVMQLGAELYEYLVGHIARRRELPGTGDLLGQLLADTSDDRLDDAELLGLSFLFVLAGLETVTSALSTAFALLAAHPPLRRQLAADPASIPGAVEELLRFDGPVVFVPRMTTRDVELGGQLIPAGTPVNIAIAAADRDAAAYQDPDTIDLQRARRHMAFGVGPHRCLGSHLARMELRATMHEWHRRIPEYELAPGVTPRVSWPAGLVGIASLPLVFRPRAADEVTAG